MRKTLLLVATAVMAVAGVAYAANTNTYFVNASITPKKSGTAKHPKPISIVLGYHVRSANPKAVPTNVKHYTTFIEDILEKTTKFPGCGTARLNDPSQGPKTCPTGSKIGSGYAYVVIRPSSRPPLKVYVTSKCRLELSIYNGGNHNLSLYFHTGKQKTGQPAPCKPSRKVAVLETLDTHKNGLTEKFGIPNSLRTVGSNTWTITDIVMNEPAKTKTVTVNHKTRTIGLFDSFACPSNGQRQVKVTFTAVDGSKATSTRNVACTS